MSIACLVDFRLIEGFTNSPETILGTGRITGRKFPAEDPQ
jgi:hypothetical protein